eukprot:4998037-Alexandrium_andersonii.AAC.1
MPSCPSDCIPLPPPDSWGAGRSATFDQRAPRARSCSGPRKLQRKPPERAAAQLAQRARAHAFRPTTN